MSTIELKNISAGYGSLQILFGLSLQASEGKITVIIGPNGAGKSTVLKAICNLCDVAEGQIIYNQKEITKLRTEERIKQGIALVPQGRQVFSTLTVRENLEMGGYLLGKKKMRARMNEVIEHFPILKEKIDHNASGLSGGEQQMLALGRGLMHEPKLLLLDEPSLGLSPKTMKEMFKKIQNLAAEGIGILMVEQNAKAACEIADYIYVLEQGKVALEGDKNILETEKLKHVYLGGHERN